MSWWASRLWRWLWRAKKVGKHWSKPFSIKSSAKLPVHQAFVRQSYGLSELNLKILSLFCTRSENLWTKSTMGFSVNASSEKISTADEVHISVLKAHAKTAVYQLHKGSLFLNGLLRVFQRTTWLLTHLLASIHIVTVFTHLAKWTTLFAEFKCFD